MYQITIFQKNSQHEYSPLTWSLKQVIITVSEHIIMKGIKFMKEIKKISHFCLLTLALLLITALTAFATEATPEGLNPNAVLWGDCGYDPIGDEVTEETELGKDVYWEIIPNEESVGGEPAYTMNIFGTGTEFRNIGEDGKSVGYWTPTDAKWGAYLKYITRATVGDNITNLGSSAFLFCSSLHTVELGANVTVLGNAAFEGCRNLKTVYRKGTDPVTGTVDLTGISSLGAYLFDGCYYIENIIFPTEGKYSLSAEFLKNNKMITTLYIPDECIAIEPLAFRECSALTNVYIEGNTELRSADINKEGGFFAYPFHNCGTTVDKVCTLSISAKSGTPAYVYAQSNASVELETPVGITQKITYEAPLQLSVYEDGSPAFVAEAVKGFDFGNEYLYENSTYLLFSDHLHTELLSGKITENKTVYGKNLISFIGYMVRVRGNQGLRAMYEYDVNAFDGISGFSVVSVGTIGAKLYGIDPQLTLDYKFAKVTEVYNGSTLVGQLAEPVSSGIATMASTCVGFEDGTSLMKDRVASELLFRAYVTIKNNTTGEIYTFYSAQGQMDLDKACEKTLEAGASTLSGEAKSFIGKVTALNIDSGYIYSKNEALNLLTTVFNNNRAILSGQHIGFSKDIVKQEIDNILDVTGEIPAVLGYDLGTAVRSGNYNDAANEMVAAQFTEYAKQGGLITFSAHITNPINGFEYTYRRPYLSAEAWDALLDEDFWALIIDSTPGNAAEFIANEAASIDTSAEACVMITAEESANDPGGASGLYPSAATLSSEYGENIKKILRNNFISELQEYAKLIKMLDDNGVPIFFRPYHETNGAWFWFSAASMPENLNNHSNTQGQNQINDGSVERFKKLWEYTYKFFENECGFDNLLWIYSPNITDNNGSWSTGAVMKYYPGDAYVDVMGIDWYESGKAPDTSIGETTGSSMVNATPTLLKEAYNNVYPSLAATGKPVVYGEFGPGSNLLNADVSLSYNARDVLQLIKDVADANYNMGWMLLWDGWQDNWMAVDQLLYGDEYMNRDYDPSDPTSFEIIDLAEAKSMLIDIHYGK